MDQPTAKTEEPGVSKEPQPSSLAQEAPPCPAKKNEEEPQPKLSAPDFEIYNHMAEHMDMFHENFRRTWNVLYRACVQQKRPNNMSIRQFLNVAGQLCHHLTIHHTIEEQHIFPVLAEKMKFFTHEEHALTQHKGIHEGIERLEVYLENVRSGEKDFSFGEMKALMDSFGDVLWSHLDDEVKELGAENMRRYWTKEEMKVMPM